MKAQHYRPNVTNGQITQRRARPVPSATRPARRKTNSSSTRQAKTADGGVRGSRILGVMLFIGLLLTGGFLLGIHSQISALHINQAEEALKTELDRTANQQKFLDLQQEQARNLAESERASRADGLAPLDLDRRHQRYQIVPASYTRPPQAATETTEAQSAAKAGARLSVPPAKAGRTDELKASKSLNLIRKATGKPNAAPAAKATSKLLPKPAAIKAGKAGVAAHPQSKAASKSMAKPAAKPAAKAVVVKAAKATPAKIAKAGKPVKAARAR